MSATGPLLLIAALTAGGTWLSRRAVSPADRDALPTRHRRRLQRWQTNARYVYTVCLTVTVAAGLAQLPRLTT